MTYVTVGVHLPPFCSLPVTQIAFSYQGLKYQLILQKNSLKPQYLIPSTDDNNNLVIAIAECRKIEKASTCNIRYITCNQRTFSAFVIVKNTIKQER